MSRHREAHGRLRCFPFRNRMLVGAPGGWTNVAAWTARLRRMVALGHILWDGDEAEVALLVEDAWQRRGVGAGLLSRLVSAAGRMAVLACKPSRSCPAPVMRGLGLPRTFAMRRTPW